jgi:hypothetical protein
MSIDVEYAIRKDIRNNPVVREVDAQQKREFIRSLLLGTTVVGALLFSAWQHQRMVQFGRDMERLRSERAAEDDLNRKLQLNLATKLAPQLLDARARKELRLIEPSTRDIVVIERAPVSGSAQAVVAQVR